MALSPNFQLNPCTLSRLQFLRFKSAKPIHKPNPYVKIQSIPPKWIQSWKPPIKPLRKPLKSALDYRNSTTSDDEDVVGTSRSTGSSTMERIVEKLKKFGYIDESRVKRDKPLPEKGSIEDIFYVEDGMLPNSRGGVSINVEEEARFPWEKNNVESLANERKKRSKSSVAELTLPEGELRRLRHLAIRMKSKIRVKGAGATKEIVDLIHEKWMTEEVVRIKCEGASALNMKRMHEILERKTGGLVIWRSGSSMSLYRGVTYETPQPVKKPYQNIQLNEAKTSTYNPLYFPTEINQQTMQDVNQSSENETRTENIEPTAEIKYESEMDALLDPLGPRYADWSGPDPLPVDADMLPGIIPGYKPPFRVLPYGVRPGLGYKDGTALRRLARVLPPHFALGRSRQHQGLAAAIVKLWESSSIVKIALKRGVQLTTSERMAEDIKNLTGGSILSRNKDFIVFYRGKDFLSSEVTEALLERERMAKTLQDEEERARLRASSFISNTEKSNEPCTTGTLEETLAANARFGSKIAEDHADKMTRAAEAAKHADLVRKLERKLLIAEGKLSKAEKVLSKVEQSLKPVQSTTDPDSITDEERFMFRKLGLKMKAFLLLGLQRLTNFGSIPTLSQDKLVRNSSRIIRFLASILLQLTCTQVLGRRGVFDGTVENMHLHWKYRELVKILVKAKNFLHVKNIALALEAESGGVLVSVDKISKGFAIIVYRGNGYVRPPIMRPKNLLTKRKALARSIELQRHEALSHHITTLRKRVEKLRSKLDQIEDVKDQGNADLYSKLDSAYATGDEDTEDDEFDEAYLETFDGAVDFDSDEVDEDGSCDSYSDRDDKNDDNEDADKDETVFDLSELCI